VIRVEIANAKDASRAETDGFAGGVFLWDPKSACQTIRLAYCTGRPTERFIVPGASPSQMTLLSETFSARASAPKPVSLGAFRPALSNMSDVSLL